VSRYSHVGRPTRAARRDAARDFLLQAARDFARGTGLDSDLRRAAIRFELACQECEQEPRIRRHA